MSQISRVFAREVLDSRGNPTIEVEVQAGGRMGRAVVPSGASTGAAEALELRDGDPHRYDGRGVLHAIGNINKILGPNIVGMDVTAQDAIDCRLLELDGSSQKKNLGGNALLGVSLGCVHAAAAVKDMPLFRYFHDLFTVCEPNLPAVKMPLPMVNMISGGLHAGGNLDFQDILVEPVGAPDFGTGLEWIVRIYRRLGELLTKAGYEGRLVGDEGGFGPRLKSNREAVEFVVRSIEAAKLRPREDVTIAIDVASTHFFDATTNTYRLKAEGDRRLTSVEMVDRLETWVNEFPIRSIEDGLAEEDWDGWKVLTQRLGARVQLVGDDFFATNPERVRRGITGKIANSVLVKVNQIGTLTETFETMRLAIEAGYSRVVSARSGETEDSTIADLAVGTVAEQIKIGSIVRSERLAKYNQLLRIAEQVENH